MSDMLTGIPPMVELIACTGMNLSWIAAVVHWSATAVQMIANGFAIIVSGIAIWVYWRKRKPISAVFQRLVGFFFQLTLSELNAKFDLLNELTVDEPSHKKIITNILGEILGQIRGNSVLSRKCKGQLSEIAAFVEGRQQISDQRIRPVIHELREKLRHSLTEDFASLTGESK